MTCNFSSALKRYSNRFGSKFLAVRHEFKQEMFIAVYMSTDRNFKNHFLCISHIRQISHFTKEEEKDEGGRR